MNHCKIANCHTEVSIKELKKKLWEVFSAFIRKRDSQDGFFTCISCSKTKSIHYKDNEGRNRANLHAGHYHKSEMSAALRYDEQNVNGQCSECNLFDEGNRQGYEKGLIKKYGPAIIQILDLRKNNRIKWGRFEYEVLIKEYEQKLKTFDAEK